MDLRNIGNNWLGFTYSKIANIRYITFSFLHLLFIIQIGFLRSPRIGLSFHTPIFKIILNISSD